MTRAIDVYVFRCLSPPVSFGVWVLGAMTLTLFSERRDELLYAGRC